MMKYFVAGSSMMCISFWLFLTQTIMLFVLVFVDIFPFLTGNKGMDIFGCDGSDYISTAQVVCLFGGKES